LLGVLVERLEEFSEQGRSIEPDAGQLVLIHLNDALHRVDRGVRWVRVERETVRNLTHAGRDAAEAERGEVPIEVVWLDDGAYFLDSAQILIL
jgi:hypothetical protein